MKKVKEVINQYSKEYLIVDGMIPIVTNSSIEDEATIYNIKKNELERLILHFEEITSKKVTSCTKVNILSFGQRNILAILFALYSKAEKILLRNVISSLDIKKREIIYALIDDLKIKNQRIIKIINE